MYYCLWTTVRVFVSTVSEIKVYIYIYRAYIAYYHIAELSARASIVNKYIMWGLKDMCEMFYRKSKNHSYVAHRLILCCSSHATHSMVPSRDGLETSIVIFSHGIHQICCDGGGPLYIWGPLWHVCPYVTLHKMRSGLLYL